MLFEARGELTRALHYYEELMAKTEGADMVSCGDTLESAIAVV